MYVNECFEILTGVALMSLYHHLTKWFAINDKTELRPLRKGGNDRWRLCF